MTKEEEAVRISRLSGFLYGTLSGIEPLIRNVLRAYWLSIIEEGSEESLLQLHNAVEKLDNMMAGYDKYNKPEIERMKSELGLR